MRFFCVNDGVPEATVRLLREACVARAVDYIEIDPRTFDYADGVSTFYADSDGIFFNATTSPLLFQRAGLPIPRTYYCPSASRELLDSYVDRLGGFPVVVKLLGYSSGVGTMRADSSPALYSLIDFALAEGKSPLVCAYIDEAVHWRLVVVGDQVVSAYRNRQDGEDFRTYAADDPADFLEPPPPDSVELAVRAVKVLHSEFGGVDVLAHPSGRLYLLEANFPCYFATGEEVIGTDVSGAMIDHLVAKAARLTAASG